MVENLLRRRRSAKATGMRPDGAYLELLDGIELFAGLSQKGLRAVADEMKELHLPAGNVIIKEGGREGRFHLIIEGTALIQVEGRTLNRVGPGDHFGEISIISRSSPTASVVAETPLRTLSIANFNFRRLMRQHPDLSYKLVIHVCRMLRRESFRLSA